MLSRAWAAGLLPDHRPTWFDFYFLAVAETERRAADV